MWRSVTYLGEQAGACDRPRPTAVLAVLVHVTEDEACAGTEIARFVRGQYDLGLDPRERWIVISTAARVARALIDPQEAAADRSASSRPPSTRSASTSASRGDACCWTEDGRASTDDGRRARPWRLGRDGVVGSRPTGP